MNWLKKVPALLVLVLVGGGIAYAGLETVTHIQDLNSAWPLGSDLASTSDDHVRNIKSALKTDFPNFNGTYTSAALPVFAIPSDTNTGMYSVGADDLGFATGGTLRLDISTTAYTGTLPWRGQDGGVGTPAISFSADTNTGFYRAGTDQMVAVAGGTATQQWFLNGATAQSLFSDGTSAIPAISFSADTDTGIFRNAANDMRVVSGGSLGASFLVTGMFVRADDANAAGPSLSFFSDTDTGFYHDTANQIGIALGGTTAGQIAQGTFTGTLTGYAAGPTGTVNYQRVGKIVTLWITAAITGTSNANTLTMTGLPAIVQPASNVETSCFSTTDNGNADGLAVARINAGTITFGKALSGTGILGGNTSWTTSGTKALQAGWSITYPIS